MTVQKILAELLKEHQLSIEELAGHLGYKDKYIKNILQSKLKPKLTPRLKRAILSHFEHSKIVQTYLLPKEKNSLSGKEVIDKLAKELQLPYNKTVELLGYSESYAYSNTLARPATDRLIAQVCKRYPNTDIAQQFIKGEKTMKTFNSLKSFMQYCADTCADKQVKGLVIITAPLFRLEFTTFIDNAEDFEALELRVRKCTADLQFYYINIKTKEEVMSYISQFGNPEQFSVPNIVQSEGWTDDSYGNDVCPRFTNHKLGICVWVDYIDPAKREFDDGKRYTVSNIINLSPEEGDYEVGEDIFETDNALELEAFINSLSK